MVGLLGWLITLTFTIPSSTGTAWTSDVLRERDRGVPVPACADGDRVVRGGLEERRPLVLVDPARRLPPSYAPDDLRSTAGLPLRGRALVREGVLPDLATFARAARRNGRPLAIRTGYRSEAFQRVIFEGWVRDQGLDAALRASARPGHSEHQLGTAIDVATPGGPAPWEYADWGATETGRWVVANAWRFGFVVSYPAGREAVTCYRYEPWHLRYVGRDVALAIRVTGLTLREYLWHRTVGQRDRG